MARLQIEQISVLKDNYTYLLHDPASGATAVVDPAEADPVLDRLRLRGWRLSHILNTHHHADHVGGNLQLRQATGAKVFASSNDAGRIPGIDESLRDGQSLQLGTQAGQVLEVPGHTLGHIAFWFADSEAIFVGDTLFMLGCGRLFEGSAAQMWASLQKISALPPATLVYCAHEYTESNARFAATLETDNQALAARRAEVSDLREKGLPTVPARLDVECATNPFLRAALPSLKRAVAMTEADPAAVFAEIRRRKDVF